MVQAKDITDAQVLAALDRPPGRWTPLWDIQARLGAYPPKVVTAKLRAMVRRGVIAGCPCGCRGDFHIPA